MKMRILGEDLKVSAVGFRMHGTVPRIRQACRREGRLFLFREAEEMGYTFLILRRCHGTADDPHVNERTGRQGIETGTQQSGDSY